MRLFTCPSCPQLVYFENSTCLRCGTELGFDPVNRSMQVVGHLQRCQGGDPTCNWLVPVGNADQRCWSCCLTVPVEEATTNTLHVQRLEAAKRRLLYTLLSLDLPTAELRFSFPATGMTGHNEGLITVVQDEADHAERERRRTEFAEPYRTLIGHLRHESGHFYWDRLVRDGGWLEEVRELFGDDRQDYQAALKKHYEADPPVEWQGRFISAYAATHPWEDWAETWAHYLHMIDALDISAAYHLTLAPGSTRGLPMERAGGVELAGEAPDDFDALLAAWIPLTHFANSLNRSIGLQDWYPFVLADLPIKKLRLVHRIVRAGPTPINVQMEGAHQNQGQNQDQRKSA